MLADMQQETDEQFAEILSLDRSSQLAYSDPPYEFGPRCSKSTDDLFAASQDSPDDHLLRNDRSSPQTERLSNTTSQPPNVPQMAIPIRRSGHTRSQSVEASTLVGLHEVARRSDGYTDSVQSPRSPRAPMPVSETPEERERRLKEQTNERRRASMRMERERRILDAAEVWKKGDIIRSWERKRHSRKTRDLIFYGIPPKYRAQVWPLAIGNPLNITPELFQICQAQAERTRQIEQSKIIGKEDSVELIPLDLPRTFAGISFFQIGGPLYGSLKSVLEAYVCYRPDIGYVQGMGYIAAMLLLSLDEYHAFRCLANLLNRKLLHGFFKMDVDHIQHFIDVLDHMMHTQIPKLHAHFHALNIVPNVFIIDWILTLFTKSLPLDIASRVWDNYFLNGEMYLFRVCLGLLQLYSQPLRSYNYDQCMVFLTHMPEEINETELFAAIERFPLVPGYSKTLDKYIAEMTNY